jgi:hypothetical protein
MWRIPWHAGPWLALLLMAAGCSDPIPNRDPTGETFPTVRGESLAEEGVTLPDAYAGEPAILLVAYEQDAQFDIDRWVLGLLQAEVDARLVELPTIPGLAADLASRWIDDGMRSGIPREEWSAVITLYGDAATPVARLTGTEGSRRTRVLLLDGDGEILWFDDEGYSPRKALALAERVEELRAEGSAGS